MQAERSTAVLKRLTIWVPTLLLVLLPFHALFTTYLGANIGAIDWFRIWKELLLVPLLLTALYQCVKRPQLRTWLKKDLLVTLIFCYLAIHLLRALAASVNNDVTSEALIYGLLSNLRFFGFFGAMMVFASQSNWFAEHWRRIVLVPAVIVVVFGLLQQFVLPPDFLSHFGYGPETIPAIHTVDQKPDYQRIQSTLRGPNPLGAYLVVIVTAFVAVAMVRKNRRLQAGILTAMSLIALFFTYSRSAWIGVALAVIVLVWHFHARLLQHRQVVISGLVCLLLLLGGIWFFRDNNLVQNVIFHTDETSQSAQSSNEARGQSLINGAKDILKEPLGRGPGTAGPASTRNDNRGRISENYFLQIGQEVGIFGLLVFIAIQAIVAHRLWQRRNDELALVLLASFIGITAINMISHAWSDDTLGMLWWGLAGIALAPAILNKSVMKKTRARS